MSRALDRIFKAYDVRGVVPDDLDVDLVRRIGAAFAIWSGASSIAIGRDCRLSSPELADAFAEGITAQGADVVDLGLASTDLLYFASGSLDVPGIMLTASHNPKEYNGLKFCLSGATARRGGHRARRDPRTRRRARSRSGGGSGDGGAERSARGLRRACALVRGCVGDAAAHRRCRYREWDGRPGRAGGDGEAAGHVAPSLSPSLTARSRITPRTRSTQRTRAI